MNTPIAEATDIISVWNEDPLLLYRDIDQSKQILNDLLSETFKMGNKQQLVFGGFKLDQVWEQIEHHTSKVNQKLVQKIGNMLSDEDFITQLSGGVELSEAASDLDNKESSYNFEKDNDDDDQDMSADYGAEDQDEGQDVVDNEESDESKVDEML